MRPEDLIPKNAKLERIVHCMEEAAGLPPGFTSNTSRELQILQRAAEFRAAWTQRLEGQQGLSQSSGRVGGEGTVADSAAAAAAGTAGLLEPPLVLKNECGVDKLVCTTLRPTCLPHVELHDMEGVVQVGHTGTNSACCSCAVSMARKSHHNSWTLLAAIGDGSDIVCAIYCAVLWPH